MVRQQRDQVVIQEILNEEEIQLLTECKELTDSQIRTILLSNKENTLANSKPSEPVYPF